MCCSNGLQFVVNGPSSDIPVECDYFMQNANITFHLVVCNVLKFDSQCCSGKIKTALAVRVVKIDSTMICIEMVFLKLCICSLTDT